MKSREERRIIRGHLWVYRNELAHIPDLEEGQVVDVFSDSGRFVGRGFFQKQGGIAVRILDRHQSDIGSGFFKGRLRQALELRERLFPDEIVYRWIFGESDGLPGLVVDRYSSIVVLESQCGFYEGVLPSLAEVLLEFEGVQGIRACIAGRVSRFGVVSESIELAMAGLRIEVPIEGGQKTGLFLDQRTNMRLVEPFAKGARIFDGHCYAGLWSCRAAMAGAESVLGVDRSEPALALARRNSELNSVAERCRFECGDVLEALKRGERYDVILLDPPALAKSRAQEGKAAGLYQALNRAAFECLNPGGTLITSTCSHFISREAFLEIIKRAAAAAQRSASILDVRTASPDHPVLMAMPETAYLTCALLRLV